MSKKEHSSFINRPVPIVADGNIYIPCYGRSIEILSSTSSTSCEISIDNASPQPLPAGIALEFDEPFTEIRIYNKVSTAITIWVTISYGRIHDRRVVFGDTLPVSMTSNDLQSDVALTALLATYNIDNAAAVDKGGGLVGVPVTGHPFAVPESITIAGSTNYDATYPIVSQTANEVVITATYIAETFAGGGAETITPAIRSIAANASQREVLVVNTGDYTVYFGDENVDAASKRGTPLTSGSDATLSLNCAVYFQAVTDECTISINRFLYS